MVAGVRRKFAEGVREVGVRRRVVSEADSGNVCEAWGDNSFLFASVEGVRGGGQGGPATEVGGDPREFPASVYNCDREGVFVFQRDVVEGWVNRK